MAACSNPYRSDTYRPKLGDVIHTRMCSDMWVVLGISERNRTFPPTVEVLWLRGEWKPPRLPYATVCNIGESSAWHLAEQCAPE